MKNNSFIILRKQYQNKSFKLYTFQIILILFYTYIILNI